ncbi:MAG: aminodeoxychorismate/anthranilate synthase component II [Nanoarchaeota archaeon]|nr:aminodeoxychorismate/anthranilate synthase component II [Nanoarchaeota archaeon]MBU1005302.1 aminodeoxychorismate/anthranilate synthase component II [Nanoarchaeota archaeon]
MPKSNNLGRWSEVRVLFIDNFDSFTYNLVDEFQKRDCEVLVYRNNIDIKTMDQIIKKFKPSLIVISPGPSTPKNAGISKEIIQNYHESIPIFGVCLGHQCIIEVFGGRVDKAVETIHGKPSKITHDKQGIFKGLENPFQAGRYHSLAGYDIPYCLEITARTIDRDIVMAVRHKEFPVIGVQFHPESILTPIGGLIINNLIGMIKK